MNPLEMQLRSWKPRRPSAGLERRLFPTSAPTISIPRVQWLAPAMACALFAVLAFNPQNGPLPDLQPLHAGVLSNQSYAAYLPGSFQRDQNRWDTFEWTNRGQSGSSVAPFSPGRAHN